ncbi:restriction endonuclease [Peptoniphilus mikwangii]|uniref:restriction endonuclease n=1 Tax=Peptoniphilus mikwangii TaxID=1354300 RepID=UPI00041042B2|nr:restriction endonuclease [Peptoniphilus mikwangii]
MLTQMFEFEKSKNKIPYDILHKNIPIKMSKELIEAIEYLLWYVPDIASIQSRENELVSNFLYDDFTFEEIMKYMHLRDEDVLFTEQIDFYTENFYKYEICPNYQKLILTKSSDETKTGSLLRHIRNSIAHGYFTIVENLLIGFDYKFVTGKREECKAIFKIKPSNLLYALKNLDTELTEERLVKTALETCGYEVKYYEDNNELYDKFDLFARRADRKYAVEIKKYKKKKYINERDVRYILELFKDVYKNVQPVLVINTSLLTEKAKQELLKRSIIILDVKNIKKLLSGRDMLFEIERDRKYKK